MESNQALMGSTEDEAKDSVLALIKWTRDTLRREVAAALAWSVVDEGVPGSIWINTYMDPTGPTAWCDVSMCASAQAEFKNRLDSAAEWLRNTSKGTLKVEIHNCTPQDYSERPIYKMVVRYEYGS